MNEISVSVAGYFIGLVITAILVAPVGVCGYFFSTFFYFFVMALTIPVAKAYKDKDNPLRADPAEMAFLIGFGCALLASGSMISGIVAGGIAAAITRWV